MSAPPSRDRIEPADERRRVLAAFVELAAERGLAETDRGAVCERAGLGRRAFERHFADRDAILAAAWDWLGEEYMRRLKTAFATHKGWRERLRAGAGETMRLVGAHPSAARFLAVESLSVEFGRERQRQLGARVAELLDGVRHQLPDPDRPPAITSSWVVGLFFDRVYRCLTAGTEAELPGELPELLFLVVSVYAGTDAGKEELRAPPP